MKTWLHLLFAAFFLGLPPARAAAPEDPEHAELRAIKDALVNAFNQRDYDGFLRHVHPNIVATWQNAEVARRPDGIRAFMKKMTEGEFYRGLSPRGWGSPVDPSALVPLARSIPTGVGEPCRP